MKDESNKQATVSVSAGPDIRLRPKLLLLLARERATGDVLQSRLAILKRQCEDLTRRLSSLGAREINAGDPLEDAFAEVDSVQQLQARAAIRLGRGESWLPQPPGTNILVTAIWDVEAMSAEEIMLLVDRIRLELVADTPKPPADPPLGLPVDSPGRVSPWDTPVPTFRSYIRRPKSPPSIDDSPKFLYIARLSEEQLTKAYSEALRIAERRAARLASAADRRLGKLASLQFSKGRLEDEWDHTTWRTDNAALLAASSYRLQDGDFVSQIPARLRVWFTVTATYYLD